MRKVGNIYRATEVSYTLPVLKCLVLEAWNFCALGSAVNKVA